MMHRFIVIAAAALLMSVATVARAQYGDISDLKVAKPEDKQSVESTPPPEGAKVLFDGKSVENFARKDNPKEPATWEVKEGGAMQVKGGDIISKEMIAGPVKIHVEFRTPYEPGDQGQGRGNSGVYVQGRYEVQVLDSYGKEKLEMGDCGSIYGVAVPAVQNVCKAPTVWQSYDIEFHPPKFDGDKKVEPARMTVWHNGVKIHENQKIELDNTTAGMGGDPKTPGPLMLQDHGDPVQFRNIWIAPLGK